MAYKVTEETINGIANAIRAQSNSTEDIKVEDFAEAILSIETGENTASAAQSAKDAEVSAISAASSAIAAAERAGEVALGIEKSKLWATGEGAVEGDETYENNAKYYSKVAQQHSDTAKGFAENAAASAATAKQYKDATKENLDHAIDMVQNLEGFNSEAWAVGTRNAIEVAETDITYHNNSKYWALQANATVTDFQANVGVSNVLVIATVEEEVAP